MVGWPQLTVQGHAGTEVTMRFAEMLNDTGSDEHLNDGPAGSIYTLNYRTAKSILRYVMRGEARGETYHPSATFFGFRYVELTATDDVTIQGLTGQVVGSNLKESAHFSCSNDQINQLYSNIRWSMRGNFLSIPTDCPQRDERLGWTGDTQIFSRAACYTADMRAFYRKWMRDLRHCQRSDGAYPDTAPLGRYGSYGNAAWADAGIIVPWNVYLMYGDTDILEENYESMQFHMSYLQANNDSEWHYNGAGTDYGDWLAYEPVDPRYVSVCYYAHVADLMARISVALGKEEEPDQYATLAAEIRREFRQRYLDGDQLIQTSQTALLMALHYNMLETDAQYDQAISSLRQKIQDNGYCLTTGFVGTAILLPTLTEYGMNDLAYDLLLQTDNPSWLYSVRQGATTVWERWDSYKPDYGFNRHEWNMNSFNHYAYGVVAEWMYRDMAGIEPDHEDPGFHHFNLRPQVDDRTSMPDGQGRIDWVKASVDTPYGAITSQWERSQNGEIRYHFVVPYNTTATFYQPQVDGTTRTVELEAGKWNF